MKINRDNAPPIVIGKRVTLGAAILGIANGFAAFYPEKSQAILAFVTPVIFLSQIVVAHHLGITTADG